MDFIKNSLIVLMLLMIFLLFLVSLTTGCTTCKNDINKVKLPEGYTLVRDIEQKIRVRCPDGYITGCQWETVEVAVDYAITCSSTN